MNGNLIGILFSCLISLFSKDYSWLGLSAIDLTKNYLGIVGERLSTCQILLPDTIPVTQPTVSKHWGNAVV